MSIRVLQLIPTLDRAGAEKQLCLLAQGLPPDDFEVQVCALARSGSMASDFSRAGIPPVLIGRRCQFDLRAFWQLKEYVAQLQPDLIHARMFAANIYGYAAARACGIRHFVASQWCVDPWTSGLQLALDGAVARRASRVVVNSEAVRDYYVRRGAPAERVQVISNGVARPDAPRTTRRQLLAELDLPDGSRLVGLIGRLCPQKRVKDAIWAADLLKVIRNDVHLLVLGDGPQRDRLRRFRDLCHIRDKVHFLGERGDVAQILPHLDVLWSTSGCAGQSNSILEALAAGVPVVATDIPSNRELVSSGTTGYLVPVGDRAAFAKYTERLLNDANLRASLSAAALQRVQADFSVEKMIASHANLYRNVVAGNF